MDITAAAIATIISTLTSSMITVLIARSNKIKDLDAQLDTILKIGIQYPYLENSDFTKNWSSKNNQNTDENLRYDLYATIMFNFLSRLCKYYKYDLNKIENHIAIKEWVRLHSKYWRDPIEPHENTDTYDEKFVNLIEKILR